MDAYSHQRALLELLLEAHPKMFTVEELRDRLGESDVDRTLPVLLGDGLATKLGDLVGVSRTVVRTVDLVR